MLTSEGNKRNSDDAAFQRLVFFGSVVQNPWFNKSDWDICLYEVCQKYWNTDHWSYCHWKTLPKYKKNNFIIRNIKHFPCWYAAIYINTSGNWKNKTQDVTKFRVFGTPCIKIHFQTFSELSEILEEMFSRFNNCQDFTMTLLLYTFLEFLSTKNVNNKHHNKHQLTLFLQG